MVNSAKNKGMLRRKARKTSGIFEKTEMRSKLMRHL